MTKRQIWLIAGIVGAVVALFCCAATIAGVIWLNRDDPEDVVDEYLAAVQADNGGAAREFLCARWRGGLLGNVATSTAWSDIVDYDVTDSETHDESATVTARVTYRVLGVADTGELQFTLIRENDDWKVCGIRGTG